ncbi:MAG TPA: hypothetical protein EYP71_04470 [Dehalococcoidia bacterium]|nr:hypothetical protein [Dehalococcoidia bacterium]
MRRQIRSMSCFANSRSIDRIVCGVINHLNHSWKESSP